MQPVKGFNLEKEIKAAIAKHDSYITCLNWATRAAYKAAGGRYIPHPTKAHTWTAENPDLLEKMQG
jgi:hypothetical protein